MCRQGKPGVSSARKLCARARVMQRRGRVLQSLNRQELMTAGVTLQMAREWCDFYRQELVRNSANPSAAGRADLMQRAVELLGGEP